MSEIIVATIQEIQSKLYIFHSFQPIYDLTSFKKYTLVSKIAIVKVNCISYHHV